MQTLRLWQSSFPTSILGHAGFVPPTEDLSTNENEDLYILTNGSLWRTHVKSI